jgi:hypothetical protein
MVERLPVQNASACCRSAQANNLIKRIVASYASTCCRFAQANNLIALSDVSLAKRPTVAITADNRDAARFTLSRSPRKCSRQCSVPIDPPTPATNDYSGIDQIFLDLRTEPLYNQCTANCRYDRVSVGQTQGPVGRVCSAGPKLGQANRPLELLRWHLARKRQHASQIFTDKKSGLMRHDHF